MVTHRDTEPSGHVQDDEHAEHEPIPLKSEKVPRHRRDGKQERADKERTTDPVHASKWNVWKHRVRLSPRDKRIYDARNY